MWERMFGRSTNNFLKNIWWAKKRIFYFSLNRSIPGFGLIISAVTALLSLFNYFVRAPSNQVRGLATIILLAFGLSGIQLLSLRILGNYLGKVLEERRTALIYTLEDSQGHQDTRLRVRN